MLLLLFYVGWFDIQPKKKKICTISGLKNKTHTQRERKYSNIGTSWMVFRVLIKTRAHCRNTRMALQPESFSNFSSSLEALFFYCCCCCWLVGTKKKKKNTIYNDNTKKGRVKLFRHKMRNAQRIRDGIERARDMWMLKMLVSLEILRVESWDGILSATRLISHEHVFGQWLNKRCSDNSQKTMRSNEWPPLPLPMPSFKCVSSTWTPLNGREKD